MCALLTQVSGLSFSLEILLVLIGRSSESLVKKNKSVLYLYSIFLSGTCLCFWYQKSIVSYYLSTILVNVSCNHSGRYPCNFITYKTIRGPPGEVLEQGF